MFSLANPSRLAFAAMALAVLAGCSALQIDVDVYKGPLINEREVQQRQYAYFAISAKPLIEQMRDEAAQKSKQCKAIACPDEPAFNNASAFLEEIYALFVDETKGLPTGSTTIDGLTKQVAVADGKPPGRTAPEESLRLSGIRSADSAMREAMIYFAQRILFVVNFEAIFKNSDGTDNTTLKAYKSSLQSLANTILLHTNDLQRQEKRDDEQVGRARVESEAIRQAFQLPPDKAFDALVTHLAPPPDNVPKQASPPPPDPLSDERRELVAAQAALAASKLEVSAYRQDMNGLLAAYRSFAGEPSAKLAAALGKASSIETKSADLDRKAVAALFPSVPAEALDKSSEAALLPFQSWLDREASGKTLSARSARLTNASKYLETEKARLLARFAMETTKEGILQATQKHLKQQLDLDSEQLLELQAAAAANVDVVRLKTIKLSKGERQLGELAQLNAKTALEAADGEKISAVLAAIRARTLIAAAKVNVKDDVGLFAVLKDELKALSLATAAGKPSREDIQLTLNKVNAQSPSTVSACEVATAKANDPCANQMGVIDELIANLRAQRVKALSAGEADKANDLLKAINAAYDQRTAMIYLRPASDYLRSVHSSSDTQQATESQYRLMLDDWTKYLKPWNEKSPDAKHKAELEKVYWQNINRVTLGGGGFTNFVLAKDDVGNWYVKAYSSDPEAIFKSATSLALFNAGNRLNTNLLQRHRLQERLDASKDAAERTELSAQLRDTNSQDSRPLLAVHALNAKRYANSTTQTATRLQAQLGSMAAALAKIVDEAHAAATPNACKLDELKSGLASLEKTYFDTPRVTLDSLLATPSSAAADKLTESLEAALQRGLTALHIYSAKVYKALDNSTAADCETIKRSAAEKARALPLAQLLDIARERRATIERYEDAIANITEVATQK